MIWRAKAPDAPSAAYASAIAVEFKGVRQYVNFTRSAVIGVQADTGDFLWSDSASANGTANCSSPVAYQDSIFSSSGYGQGCALVKITGKRGRAGADLVYQNKDLRNHHGGIVLDGKYVYGSDEGVLKCLDVTTGKVRWQDRSVGKGAVVYADGKIILRSEQGPVALLEANPNAYREHGRFDQPDRSGQAAWCASSRGGRQAVHSRPGSDAGVRPAGEVTGAECASTKDRLCRDSPESSCVSGSEHRSRGRRAVRMRDVQRPAAGCLRSWRSPAGPGITGSATTTSFEFDPTGRYVPGHGGGLRAPLADGRRRDPRGHGRSARPRPLDRAGRSSGLVLAAGVHAPVAPGIARRGALERPRGRRIRLPHSRRGLGQEAHDSPPGLRASAPTAVRPSRRFSPRQRLPARLRLRRHARPERATWLAPTTPEIFASEPGDGRAGADRALADVVSFGPQLPGMLESPQALLQSPVVSPNGIAVRRFCTAGSPGGTRHDAHAHRRIRRQATCASSTPSARRRTSSGAIRQHILAFSEPAVRTAGASTCSRTPTTARSKSSVQIA